MSHVAARFVIVLAVTLLIANQAVALVTTQSVTPASVKEDGSRFSVKAEKGKDGLIEFTIEYRLPAPGYLVAHFELRDGAATLARTDTPSFVREQSVTYHVAVSPAQLAHSTFELSENSFGESGGHPVPLPGGTIYQIKLDAFGKDVR